MSGAQVPAGYIGQLAGISLIPTVDAPTSLHRSSLNIRLEDGAVGVIDGFPQRGRGEPPESAPAVAYNVPGFLSVREMREAMRRAAYQGDSDDSESEEASEVATAGETKDISYTSRPSVTPRKLQATRAPMSADRPVVAGGAGVAAGRTGRRAARTSIDLGINEGLGNEGRSRRVTPLVLSEIPAPVRTRDRPAGAPTPAGPVPGGRQKARGVASHGEAEGSSSIPCPKVTPSRPCASGTPSRMLPEQGRLPVAGTANSAAQRAGDQLTGISNVIQARGRHGTQVEQAGPRTVGMTNVTSNDKRVREETEQPSPCNVRSPSSAPYQEGLEKFPTEQQYCIQVSGDRSPSSLTSKKRNREDENYEGPYNPTYRFEDKPPVPEQTGPRKRHRSDKAQVTPDASTPSVTSGEEDKKHSDTESNSVGTTEMTESA